MNKFISHIVLACVIAIALVGCKPNEEPTEQEFFVNSKYILLEAPFSDKYENQVFLVESQLKADKLFSKTANVLYKGDKQEVLNQVMDNINAAVGNLAEQGITATLHVYLTNQSDVNVRSTEEPIADKYIGTPVNGAIVFGLFGSNTHRCQWVAHLGNDKVSSDDKNRASFGVVIPGEVETYLEHTGNGTDLFAEQAGATYITDVIGVYSKEKVDAANAKPITVDGRKYTVAKGFKAIYTGSNEYFFFYTTTEPVKDCENYFLNTGLAQNESEAQCRSVATESLEDLKKEVAEPFEAEGRNFVERIVPGYSIDGKYLGPADIIYSPEVEKEHMGFYYILTYAKK